MKLSTLLLLALGATNLATAQIVTSPSVNGWVKVSTSSWDWRYVSSGGGRGSHNHHWAPIGDQSKSASVPLPFNGSTGTQSETGNYFSPSYTASSSAGTSFTNGTAKGRHDLGQLV